MQGNNNKFEKKYSIDNKSIPKKILHIRMSLHLSRELYRIYSIYKSYVKGLT